jgi:hypothetical protein
MHAGFVAGRDACKREASTIHMAEIPARREPVADTLLQRFDIGEAAVAFAFPDDLAVDVDLKRAAGRGPERHLADLLAEGREKLLRHPRGTEQPMALRAIDDGDARLGLHVRSRVGRSSAPIEQ